MDLASASRLLQRIPPVRGKVWLARWLLRRQLARTDVELRSRYGDRYRVPHLAEPVAYHILINGEYEPHTLAALARLARPGGVLVDAGANVGFFSITLARRIPGLRVFAVEASARIAGYLRANIEANDARAVTVVQCALSDSSGARVAFGEAPDRQFGMGTLAPGTWPPGGEATTLTLDELVRVHGLAAVDVIKMDIEGAEALALRGGAALLRSRPAPAIVFEFADWAENAMPGLRAGAAQQVLRDHGYRIWRLDGWLRGAPPLADVLTHGIDMLVALHCDAAT